MANWYSNTLTVYASPAEQADIMEELDGLGGYNWTDSYIESNELRLRTPWEPDLNEIDWIAQKYPNASFSFTYLDTFCYYCGMLKYRQGKCILETVGYYGPSPMDLEDEHPYVYYEESKTNRLFYEIEGVWTEVERPSAAD